VSIKTKAWIERDGQFVIGEGGIGLLEAVGKLGSLSAAAQQVGWSYRHAWGYVQNAQRRLDTSLVVAVPGKGAGRGMRLTEAGRLLLSMMLRARDRAKTVQSRNSLVALVPEVGIEPTRAVKPTGF
jgi:molybdate transport system regulatory protein